MNPNLSDWDDDLPPEPEEAYQDLLRALKRKSGFGLFFVQCTPGEADKFIVKLPQEIPQKKIAVLRFVEAIDNLYQPVAEFIKDKQIDILLIKGLEYSLYKYEKRSFGEITEGQFSNLTSVPHILNHLNQQRERFRDDFPIRFVFLLGSFSINYFIHRAPDFFDWRSGVFELPTTPEVVEKESTRLLDEADYEEYLKLSQEQKIEKVLEIQDLLREKHQTESRKASLLRELGRLLTSAKEYEAAIASYDKAIEIKPDYHYAWNSRGIALGNLKRYEDAMASYDKALEIKPDYHYAWYSRGIALGKLERYEEEIVSYDKAIEIEPSFSSAWYNRGIAFKDLGRWEEALASLGNALKIEPDYDSSWNWQGNVLDKLGRYEEAISCYDRAIVINPNYDYSWYNRANVLCKLKSYDEAVASYDKALEIQPDDHEAWKRRGIALLNLGRYEDAIASYDKALEIKPDFHEAWGYRGYALCNLGRYEEVIASFDNLYNLGCYEEVIASFDNLYNLGRYEEVIASFDNLYNLGRYEEVIASFDNLYNLGRYEEVIASFDKVLEIKPDDYQTWNNRGYLLLKPDSSEGMTAVYDKALEIGLHLRNIHNNLERYEEALSNFDKALELKPDLALTWANRSFALYYLNKYQEALTNCNKAIDLMPDDYVAWSNQGFALMKLERFEEAIISFDKVLKLKSDNHSACYNKACCYALQGNVELALENLQQAINMSLEEYQQMAKTDSYFDDIRGGDCFQSLIQ